MSGDLTGDITTAMSAETAMSPKTAMSTKTAVSPKTAMSAQTAISPQSASTGWAALNGVVLSRSVLTQRAAPAHSSPDKNQGFTLIELMVVIVIAAILLTIAVPSFDNMIRRNTVESLQTTLGGALATARTEAASRNSVVTICAINAAGEGCSGAGGGWSSGWIVFEDRNASGEVDGDDIIIDVFEYSGGYTFTASNSTTTAPARLSFNSQGFLAGDNTPTLITICDPRSNANFARGMFVNASGLVMKTSRQENSEVHGNPLGGSLTC